MSAQENGNSVASPPEVEVPSGVPSQKKLIRRRPAPTSERKLRTLRPASANGRMNGSALSLANGSAAGAAPAASARAAANGAPAAVPAGNGVARTAAAGNGLARNPVRSATSSPRLDATRPALRPLPEAPQASFLSTVRGKVICASAVGVVLLGAIGILLWIKSNEIDPQQVKEEMKAEIAQVNALPEDKLLEKDDLLHVILENPLYLQYGADIRKGVARTHEKLHQSAEELRKARDKVKPFLTRYQSLKASPDRLRAEAQRYYDESRALHDQFGTTAYGARLAEVVQELEGMLESRPDEKG